MMWNYSGSDAGIQGYRDSEISEISEIAEIVEIVETDGCSQGYSPLLVLDDYGIITGVEIACTKCEDGSSPITQSSKGLYVATCKAVPKEDDSEKGPDGPGSPDSKTGLIVGCVIAAVVVVAAIVLGCVFGIKACKNKKAGQAKQSGNEQALQPISSGMGSN